MEPKLSHRRAFTDQTSANEEVGSAKLEKESKMTQSLFLLETRSL